MRQRLEIYSGRGDQYEKELARLKDWKTSKVNKELITRWHNHLFAVDVGQDRVCKLSSQIRKIVLHLGKNLDEVTKDDVETIVAQYNREPTWREATKADYKRCLKQFYKWFKENDKRIQEGDKEALILYNYLEKYVKVRYKDQMYDYSEIISEQEIHQVIDKGCANVKEKAFLSILHEAGFRAAEILNLQIRDLEFKEDRVVVKVDGKTGMRRVPLVRSMGYLGRWLDEHPFKDNEQAFLWTGHNSRMMHQPIRHVGAQKLINRCFERAGMQKKHNLHWFRHSRATLNAPHFSEVILCKFFGWAIGSQQVRRYVHSNVLQVEDAVLKMNGLQKAKEEEPKIKQCVCGMPNESEARYCHKCGKPLSVTIIVEDEEKKNLATDEAFDLLRKILEDPKLAKKFDQFKKNIGKSSLSES